MKSSKIYKHFFFLLIINFGLANSSVALMLDSHQAAEDAITEKLEMPAMDPDGRIQTMNLKGAMSPKLDYMSLEFVRFAATQGVRVLDVGAAYGLACTEALKLGAKNYVANDLDARHLKLLALNVKNKNPNYLNRIKLDASDFIKESQYKDNSFDAILAARILHFLSPDELEIFLSKAYRILKPGGRLYAVMISPYVKGYSSFIPEYEERIKSGERYPGFVKDLTKYVDFEILPATMQDAYKKKFMFFDTRIAKSSFEGAGFRVEHVMEMPLLYSSIFWQLDGRENVGIVGFKPSS